jgi:tetratricopeptide (TPR) repeat protein
MEPIRLSVDEETQNLLREISGGLEDAIKDLPKTEDLKTELADALQKSFDSVQLVLQAAEGRQKQDFENAIKDLPKLNELRHELGVAVQTLTQQALQSSKNTDSQIEQLGLLQKFNKLIEWFTYLDSTLKTQRDLLQALVTIEASTKLVDETTKGIAERVKVIEEALPSLKAQLDRANRPWWKKVLG